MCRCDHVDSVDHRASNSLFAATASGNFTSIRALQDTAAVSVQRGEGNRGIRHAVSTPAVPTALSPQREHRTGNRTYRSPSVAHFICFSSLFRCVTVTVKSMAEGGRKSWHTTDGSRADAVRHNGSRNSRRRKSAALPAYVARRHLLRQNVGCSAGL